MQAALPQHKFNIADLLRRGLAYHKSGRHENARQVYRNILAHDPLHPDALNLSGLLALEAGDPEHAEMLISRAIQADSGQPDFYNNLGNVLLRKGELSEAISYFRQAIDLKSDDAAAYYNLANALQMAGRPAEAVGRYRQALQIDSGLTAAWLNMGRAYRQQKENNFAADCFRQVLKLKPDWADAHEELGDIAHEQSQPQSAIAHYKNALNIRPESWLTWFKLGNLYRETGAASQALACYQSALSRNPGAAEIYLNLGLTLKAAGNFAEAEQCYRKCIEFSPQMAVGCYNLGNLCLDTGRFEAAVGCYRKALDLDPTACGALINLGNIYLEYGRLDQALSCFEQTLRVRPDNTKAIILKGNAFMRLNRAADALALFQQALEIDPEASAAYIGIENALKQANRIDDALSIYRQIQQKNPFSSGVLFHQGLILRSQGRHIASKQAFQRAYEVNPGLPAAQWHAQLALPVLYRSRADITACRAEYEAGLTVIGDQVDNPAAGSPRTFLEALCTGTNFYLPYQGANDRALQKRYGEIVCRIVNANFPQWASAPQVQNRQPDGRIKIGFISAYLKAHTVGRLFQGWVQNCDRSQFEVYCFLLSQNPDAVSRRYQSDADHFYSLWGEIESIARRIRSYNLHLLIYPDIGMYAPATALAGLRLAPVQCAAWGHPVTTGLPSMDYYLSSNLMEPANAAEHYTERLIRLPNLSLCYERPAMPAHPKSPPALGISRQDFVYLSPQSLFKYLPQYDEVFPRIARQVPQAKFVFISDASRKATDRFRKRLAGAFAKTGLEMGKFCLFQPRLARDDYFSLNLASHVLLDPFCWSGGKSTLEAISCGLPVVTCPGEFMRGRHSYAMLRLMKIEETIAADQDEYVALAVRLACDRHFYSRMRRQIADRSHLIFEDLTPVRALEAFIKKAVELQRWPSLSRHKIRPPQKQDFAS